MGELIVNTWDTQVPQTFPEALRLAADLAERLEIAQSKATKYDHFLNSKGEIDCTSMADLIQLYYITPQGKYVRMGGQYFIQLLVLDKIIYKTPDGYRLYASHKEYGRTAFSQSNGLSHTSVLFNKKGADYLLKKYEDDSRRWCTQKRNLVLVK